MGNSFGAPKVALWMADPHFRRQEPGLFEFVGSSCMKGSVARNIQEYGTQNTCLAYSMQEYKIYEERYKLCKYPVRLNNYQSRTKRMKRAVPLV
jgi:hypothetical protein